MMNTLAPHTNNCRKVVIERIVARYCSCLQTLMIYRQTLDAFLHFIEKEDPEGSFKTEKVEFERDGGYFSKWYFLEKFRGMIFLDSSAQIFQLPFLGGNIFTPQISKLIEWSKTGLKITFAVAKKYLFDPSNTILKFQTSNVWMLSGRLLN